MVMNDLYQMSSPGQIDPYYDCGLGNGMTPTVVSNFQMPNTGINKDGPYLEIVHQPQSKFRFRYKSEMVGTHGQLKAESSNKNNNIFPTVKLCNWNRGSALIRLMLYTADENANERKRHVHELSGKSVHKEGFSVGYEVVADEKINYTPHFSNLGIIHIAKRDVQNIIFQRKKEELINHACSRNPNLPKEGIQHNISPTDLQKLKEAAEEEAKSMDLNKVVLRFQAFFLNQEAGCYQPITEPVFSDVIFNLKNASTGELKIVRLSAACASCTGGTEIWMLVEKVKKNNVKIKFYEQDADNCEVWKGYAEFKESDVHHQYAIVFKVPPYENANIREPVHVKIQLERPTDNDTSESLDFTYIPETLKRSNAYLENRGDVDIHPIKRPRSAHKALNLVKKKDNLFLEGADPKQPYSPEAPYQSPSQMVPSPIGSAASPSSQGFYSPLHQGGIPSIHMSNEEEHINFIGNSDDSQGLSSNFDFGQQQVMESVQQPLGSPNFQFQLNDVYTRSEPLVQSNMAASTHSPYHQVPSYTQSPRGYNMSPFYGDTTPRGETAQHQIQQFDAVHKKFVSSQVQVSDFDFKDLVSSAGVSYPNDDMDLLNMLGDKKIFHTSNGYGDIQADSAVVSDKNKQMNKNRRKNKMVDLTSLTNKMSTISMSEKYDKKPDLYNSESVSSDKDLAFRVAVKAAECLQIYAASGDISRLLATHRFLLGVQNNQGDNSLHTAVSNRNFEAFNKIISAAREVFCSDLLNAQNYAGETPLHLAVRAKEARMVEVLIGSPGCQFDIGDHEGNTALHLAAAQPHLLRILLASVKNNKIFRKLINTFNYDGQTCLHIGVSKGDLGCVKLLVNSGAEVHQCERKRGANPLHLAVAASRHDVTQFLIQNTDITVDAGRFDGNTALHIAAVAADADMCLMLMQAQANPHARNSLRKYSKVSESEQEDEDSSNDEDNEENFFSVFDYAADNEEILEILNGKYDVKCETKNFESHTLDSGIGISSTDLQDKTAD